MMGPYYAAVRNTKGSFDEYFTDWLRGRDMRLLVTCRLASYHRSIHQAIQA